MTLSTEWTGYTYDGDPQFAQVGDSENPPVVLTIENNTLDDKGTWFCSWVGEIVSGQEYRVGGAWELGRVKAIWWSSGEFLHSDTISEPGDTVYVPDGADGLRLDLRWWNQIGTAKFTGMTVELVTGTGIPIPEPIEPPTMTQLTGIQWGGHYYMVEHPLEVGEPLPVSPPIPPDGEAFEIQAVKLGRNIILEILHPLADTPDDIEA